MTGNGSGTIATTQLFTSAAWTQVNLDTEVTDAWFSHLLTSNLPYTYAMFPGVYLAEFAMPVSYTGGAGVISAGITAQEGTGPATTYGGQCVPASNSSGHYTQPGIAKLLVFSVTGDYGAPGNNFCGGALFESSGSSITSRITASRYPLLTVEWLADLTGTSGLPVPDIDTWPAAPLPVTSAFLDKNVRDTINFLAYRPVMEAYYAAGGASNPASGSLPSLGGTVPLDTAYMDNRAAFGTSNSVWTAPVPGVYWCYGQASQGALATTVATSAGLNVASANYNGGTPYTVWGGAQTAITSGGTNCSVVHRTLRLNAGDTVSLSAFNGDSGTAPTTLTAGTWTSRLITVWRNS